MKQPNPQARYDGAAKGRRLASWNPPASGPMSATSPAIPTLRNRIRDLVRNDAIAASAVRVLTNSLIGFGIQCRPQTDDPELKTKLIAIWDKWCKHASTCGADMAQLQVLVARSLFTDGECFLRIVTRKPTPGREIAFQLMPLESDMLPLLDADVYPNLPEGHTIRQGIELDPHGRRIAYHFHRQHPGEPKALFSDPQPGELVRLPADEVLHIADFQRIGQLRGVSPLASVIVRLKNVGDYDDAVLECMKLANLFVGFIHKPLPSGTSDVMTSLPFEGTVDAPISTLEPGMMQELLPGEDVKFSEPPDAGAEYSNFMRMQYQAIGAAVGVPLEMLTGELRDISDRTLRFAVGEYRRRIDQILWTVLVPQFLNPTRAAFGNYARLAGLINADEHAEVENCTWAPPAQAPIHPLQDLNALKIAVDAGFRSRSSVIAGFGDDPERVDFERAEDATRANALGLQTADEAKTAAEVAKLEAEATAAEKAAEAATQTAAAARAKAAEAKASTDVLKAQQRTAEATREHDLAVAMDRAKTARLEVQAAEIGMRELTGGRKK